MRFATSLVALALGGSANFAAAALCKPDTRDNTDTRSATTAPGSTTTTAPRTVRNKVINGNFEGYDPSSDGGIYGFQAENEARLVEGQGYQGDGSQESNCVLAEARNTGSTTRKRDIAEFAAIEQQLSDLDTTSLYTIRFWYKVLQNDVADTCKFDVYYGSELFTSSPYFPVVQSTDSTEWESVVDQAAVQTSSGFLRFDLNCASGGYAQVYVDQVFVSNEVSPDQMDNISLVYTWAYSSTSTTQQGTTSATDVTTTQDSTTLESTTSAISTTSAVSTTAAESSTSTTQSATSSTSAAATSTGNKVCVTLGTTGDAGRGCGLRPYNPSTGYKTISSTRMTRDQCGAVCLADENCQQFQWDAYSSSYACLNICILLSSNLASTASNNGFSYYAYDRSCIKQTDCTAQPDGTTCVNGLGDTPAAGCRSRVTGTVKSCSSAFLTTSVGFICDGSKECRDICAKYPDCKSYSTNYSGGCSLYPGTVSQIVDESASGTTFYDMSCNECGSGDLGYFNYVTQLTTAVTTVNDCPAVVSTSTALASSSTSTSSTISESSSTSVDSSTSIDTTTAPGATTTPSTTTASSSTVSHTCPAGISYPGACYSATPTASGSTCGKKGWVWLTDAYGIGGNDWKQDSVEDCALYCEVNSSQCSAYGFSDGDTTGAPCRFVHDSLTLSGFQEDSSYSTTWYDMGCVTCIMCDAATASTSAPASTSSCALNNGEGCTLKTLVDSGYHCDQAGTVQQEAYGYSNADYPFQGSSEQCAAICAQKTGCKASSYDSSRSSVQCAFIGVSLSAAGFSASGGTSSWSDQACWNCPSCSGAVSTPASTTLAFSTPGSSTPVAFTITATTPAASTLSAFTTFETSTLPPGTTPGDETSLAAASSTPSQTTSTSTTGTSTTSQAAASSTSCVATASLTDDVTCGLPGSAGNQAQSNYLTSYIIKPVANLQACAQICLDRADCLGFQYLSDTKVCYPYRIGTSGLGLTYVSTSKARFYDRDCFACA
ncbi:hypothetical protein G7Z17_g6769 [Cylindrodendrum hubeiense]|uniref:Apple domain-containing protein n=1 Tax=Cylindrodendrum hubeiense TaxID=595255 RepID=A0A9P5LAI8_9HYPO|nr:hypothetical protein G7Z17_g6769 [Cylindrodendrum hubeiense]